MYLDQLDPTAWYEHLLQLANVSGPSGGIDPVDKAATVDQVEKVQSQARVPQ